MQKEKTKGIEIEFKKDGDNILAILSLSEKSSGFLNAEDIVNKFIDSDFTDYYLHKEAFEELLEVQENLTDRFVNIIATKKDGEVKIEISPDKMSAYITIKQAYGGKKIDKEEVNKAILNSGVVYGIMPEVLENISLDFNHKILFARGTKSQNGKNSRFEVLIDDKPRARPKELEDGKVDFKNMGIIVKVEPGTHLMRRIPADLGKPGKTVTGEEIPQKKGINKNWGKGKGAEISKDDPNLLIAKIGGQVKIKSNFVNVEPIFNIEEVGVKTGDIDFPGTVIINENITENYKVKASGDVIVNKLVDGGSIESYEDIYLKGGVIGHEKTVIRTNGKIYSKFIENANVFSGKSIKVNDVIIHSNVTALGDILVGENGGRAQIIGGKIKALNLVQAKVIGSLTSANTYIEVGEDIEINKEILKIRKDFNFYKKQSNELIKNIVFAKTNKYPKDKIYEMEKKLDEILIILNKLDEDLKWFEENVIKNKKSQIIVKDKIYAGTIFKIAGVSHIFTETVVGGTFKLYEDKIICI